MLKFVLCSQLVSNKYGWFYAKKNIHGGNKATVSANIYEHVSRHFNLPSRSEQHMAICGLFLHLGNTWGTRNEYFLSHEKQNKTKTELTDLIASFSQNTLFFFVKRPLSCRSSYSHYLRLRRFNLKL